MLLPKKMNVAAWMLLDAVNLSQRIYGYTRKNVLWHTVPLYDKSYDYTMSNLSEYCACHAKWISWLIRIAYDTSLTMRRATGSTLQPHEILRLLGKMNLMVDPHHIWNVIYNAHSKRHHPPTSRNTAPARQNESHGWSASHMKRHLQCA